jgi:hypothetical protein
MTLFSALTIGLRLIVIVLRNLLVSLGSVTLVLGIAILANNTPERIDSIIESVSWISMPFLAFAMFWFTNKGLFATVTSRFRRYFLKVVFCLLFSFIFYCMLFAIVGVFFGDTRPKGREWTEHSNLGSPIDTLPARNGNRIRPTTAPVP